MYHMVRSPHLELTLCRGFKGLFIQSELGHFAIICATACRHFCRIHETDQLSRKTCIAHYQVGGEGWGGGRREAMKGAQSGGASKGAQVG